MNFLNRIIMNNLKSVSEIRQQITTKCNPMRKEPGIYRWWFKEYEAKKILNKISFNDYSKLQSKEIDQVLYVALYFGISKDMKGRASWHICQKHTQTAVKHGTLSTLRQTLSALLDIDMILSENFINEFIDDNCYLEWDYDSNPKEVEITELSHQNKFSYPLNIQENKTVEKSVITNLKRLRKLHKK